MIPKPSACIIDAMAPLHKISGEKKTFCYLREIIFAPALKDGTSNGRINMIFDVYKDINRWIRVMTDEFLGSILFGQNILPWRSIIGCLGVNPTCRQNYFVMCGWSSCLMKLGDNVLNKPGRFFQDWQRMNIIPFWSTSQEEMDTWLFCMWSSSCCLMTLMILQRVWKHLCEM